MPRSKETIRLSLPDDGELHGDLSGIGDSHAVLLFVHGFSSRRTGEKSLALEQCCARRGWAFAAFDFRGHGDSSGRMLDLRPRGLQADLDAIADYLRERGCRRLCLVGSSMGGWASAWFALRRPELVPACVLIAPAFRFLTSRWESLSEPERLAWRQTGRHRIVNDWVDTEVGLGGIEEADQFPPDRLLTGWSRPLLIYHGMRDEVVPVTLSQDFVNRVAFADVELHLFKDGDHRLSTYKDVLAEGACDFFQRYL
jgi:pimeloyl-ACP methyl ester carboxylesterase